MIEKINLSKAYNFLKKYYRCILGIIFALLICINALVYYQYVYLMMKVQPEPVLEKIAINQEILQKVLDNLNIRDANLSRVKTTQYTDPFK